jgi:hypothetical protein
MFRYKLLFKNPEFYFIKTPQKNDLIYLNLYNKYFPPEKFLTAHLFEHYFLILINEKFKITSFKGSTSLYSTNLEIGVQNDKLLIDIVNTVFDLEFVEEYFHLVKEKLINEIKITNLNTENILYNLAKKLAFKNVKILTNEEQLSILKKLNLNDIENFYKNDFLNNNLKIFVSSSDASLLRELSKYKFSKAKAYKIPSFNLYLNQKIIFRKHKQLNDFYYCFLFIKLPLKIKSLDRALIIKILATYLKLKIQEELMDTDIYRMNFTLEELLNNHYLCFYFLSKNKQSIYKGLQIIFKNLKYFKNKWDNDLFKNLLKPFLSNFSRNLTLPKKLEIFIQSLLFLRKPINFSYTRKKIIKINGGSIFRLIDQINKSPERSAIIFY